MLPTRCNNKKRQLFAKRGKEKGSLAYKQQQQIMPGSVLQHQQILVNMPLHGLQNTLRKAKKEYNTLIKYFNDLNIHLNLYIQIMKMSSIEHFKDKSRNIKLINRCIRDSSKKRSLVNVGMCTSCKDISLTFHVSLG